MAKRSYSSSVWEGVEVVTEQGKSKQVKCHFCESTFTVSSTSRLTAHILQQSGQGVSTCSPKDEEKKAAHKVLVEKVAAEVTKAKVQKTAKSGPPASIMPFLVTASSKVDVDRAVRDFFFETATPFARVEHRAFTTMIEKIRRLSAATTYELPDRKALAGPLLDDAVQAMDQTITTALGRRGNNGLTLTHDGWTSAKKTPVFNAMLCTTAESWYVGNKTITGTKSMEVVANYIAEVVNNAEPEVKDWIVHVCVDGGCANALPIVEQKLEKVLGSICLLHTVDLVFEDQCDWNKKTYSRRFSYINNICKKAVEFVRWWKSRERLVSLMTERTPLCLLCPIDTRMGTTFICLKRLLQLKTHLRAVASSSEFTNWRAAQKTAAAKSVADEKRALIVGDDLWEDVSNVCSLSTPTWSFLRVLDVEGAGPAKNGYSPVCVGNARMRWEEYTATISQLPLSAFLTSDRRDDLVAHSKERWVYAVKPVHEAGYALNPATCVAASSCPKAKHGLQVVLDRLLGDSALAALAEWEDWLSTPVTTGMAHTAMQPANRDQWPAHRWWSQFGSAWPNLQRVCVKLLGQTVSVAPCERGWSAYSEVLSKKRFRLNDERAHQLTRVKYNARNWTTTQAVMSYFRALRVGEDHEESDEEAPERND